MTTVPPTMKLPPGAFAAMGTVVSVRPGTSAVGDRDASASPPLDDQGVLGLVADVFARWERRFSRYEAGSEPSRVARGELALPEASAELRAVYARALAWRARTDGCFTPHRADGVIDLDGIVKALAVEDAGDALDAAGRTGWALDAGGDILIAEGSTVRVGVADPHDRSRLLAGFDLDGARRRALATSGSAERGDHIWTTAGLEHTPFVQVSVAAADLVTADVLATAIVAGGYAALDELAERFDVDVLVVGHGRELRATPGWPRAGEARAD